MASIILILTFTILLFSCPSARADTISAEAGETGSLDYDSLGILSAELNPNENPDKVIALLEPHKDSGNNKSFTYYNNLGLAYKNKGRYKDAITAYKHSLRLEPDEPSTQYNLGIAYYNSKELPSALRYFLESAEQRPDHPGTKKWIDYLTNELKVYNIPDISKLKLVFDKNINVNRKKPDKESRLRIYNTNSGGRIQVLSVDDKIYSYGIDSDARKPVDYVIIDNNGDGRFEKIINSKGIFEVPSWAYDPG